MRTADRARGKWRGILIAFGVDGKFLTTKHSPCPFCEGRDRFRWTNKDGNGGFICNQCGSGDGFEFVKRFKSWDYATAAKEIDQIVGGVAIETKRQGMTEKQRHDMLNRLWLNSTPLTGNDMASDYLDGRGVLPATLPSCLRFAPHCPIPYGGGFSPAMIALVHGPDGVPVTIHRTFLGPNGKADMENPRATMAGEIPEGSAIRLFPIHGARLGVAEGIETALAASKRFGIPVWSAIDAGKLTKWAPPPGVEHVMIFGDCDQAYGGQAAAYALAHRLVARCRLKVEVKIPAAFGEDWASAGIA